MTNDPESARPLEPALALELKRKAFHLLTLLYLGAYLLLGPDLALAMMAVWMFVIFTVETARLRTERGRALVDWFFRGIIRTKEAARYTGAFYTSLGALCVFFFFGRDPGTVKAALLYLALGDAVTAVVGRRWGAHPYQIRGETRSLEGTAAGVAVALVCGFSAGLTPAQCAAGAAVFTVADALPIPPDDNLWIPVLTGAALFTLRQM